MDIYFKIVDISENKFVLVKKPLKSIFNVLKSLQAPYSCIVDVEQVNNAS